MINNIRVAMIAHDTNFEQGKPKQVLPHTQVIDQIGNIMASKIMIANVSPTTLMTGRTPQRPRSATTAAVAVVTLLTPTPIAGTMITP